MTNDEAITWLSNDVSARTIWEYEKIHGKGSALPKIKEAIDVAVDALERDKIRRVK